MGTATSSALEDKLTSILSVASNEVIDVGRMSLSEALSSTDRIVAAKAAVRLNEISKDLPALLMADARFPGSKVLQTCDGNGAQGFYPNFVSGPLFRRLLATNDPSGTVQWLLNVLKTKTAVGYLITAIWGAPVNSRIQLTPTISLCPLDDLPESTQKSWITSLAMYDLDGLVPTALGFTPPSSAIIERLTISPFLHDPDGGQPLQNSTHQESLRAFDDVVCALTAVGPRAVLAAATWFSYEDPDLEMSRLGGGRFQQFIEILPSKPIQCSVVDAAEAISVVQRYVTLRKDKPRTHDKLRIALRRLNQSLRRHDVGDKAIELSIALEALLGDSDNSEMTHKISVRAARLASQQPAERTRCAEIVRKTYSIRSKLVHTGHVDSVKPHSVCGEQISPAQLLDEAGALCAKIIKATIEGGEIPDWRKFDISKS
jgi:hypothetical protein